MTSTRPAPGPAAVPARGGGVVLLAALLLAAVALRPQLVGAGPLIPAIQDDLAVSHAVAGLVGTIPVLCMGVFAPAAGLIAGRWGLRAAMAGCLAAIAVVGLGRAVAPGAAVLLALTLPIGIAMAVAGTLLPVAVKQRFAQALGRAAAAAPVRRPIVWAIVLAFALPSAVYYGLVAWIADAYQERGWSDESAGAVLAVMGISAIPAGLVMPWLADRMGTRRAWMGFAAGCIGLATFGFAALPGAGFAWAVCTGIALGTVFPISLTMCLDVARGPAEAGAAAALMFLAGYPIAALGPLGAGAVRDLTGSFDASLWALFGTALLMAAAIAPLTPARLHPAAP